jgi:hypothetical protein
MGRTTGAPAGAPLGRARRFAGLAGLLAGLAAFALGEAAYKRIPVQQLTFNTMGTMVTAATPATSAVAEVRNAALAFGLLGLCLGGCLGLAGGWARGSATAAVTAGLLGAILGAAVPAGVSLATLQAFADARARALDYDIPLSMLMHGAIWGLIGGISGLAFAIGTGRRGRLVRAALAGFVGAVLGAVLFDLVGAVVFPRADTGDPVSTTWPSRLTARLLVALATAAGLIVGLSGTSTPRAIGREKPPGG